MAARREARKVQKLLRESRRKRAAALAETDEERSAWVRLAAREVQPAHRDSRAAARRVFRYPRTSPALHALAFVLGVVLTVVAALQLRSAHLSPEQRLWASVCAVAFFVATLALPISYKLEQRYLRLGITGVTDHRPLRKPVTIRWPEIVDFYIDAFPVRLVIEAHHPHRRIRIGTQIEHFGQLLEAIVAEGERMEQADAEEARAHEATPPPRRDELH